MRRLIMLISVGWVVAAWPTHSILRIPASSPLGFRQRSSLGSWNFPGLKGPGSVGSPRFSLGQAVILDQLIEAPEGREQVRQS
jgi:hypothetical protein